MPDARLPGLYEKRLRLHNSNVELLRSLQAAGQDVMTSDQEATYNATDEAMEAVSRTIEKIEKSDRIGAMLEQRQERQTESIRAAVDTRAVPNAQVALRQMRQSAADWDLAFRGWLLQGSSEQGEHHVRAAQRVGWNLGLKEVTINFSAKALQSTSPHAVREWRERAQTITTTGGGYTIPDDVMQPLERALLYYGPMRQSSTIVRTERGSDLPWPTVNDTSTSGV